MWRPQPQACRLRYTPRPRVTSRPSQRPLWQRKNRTDPSSAADTTSAPSHSLVSTVNPRLSAALDSATKIRKAVSYSIFLHRNIIIFSWTAPVTVQLSPSWTNSTTAPWGSTARRQSRRPYPLKRRSLPEVSLGKIAKPDIGERGIVMGLKYLHFYSIIFELKLHD